MVDWAPPSGAPGTRRLWSDRMSQVSSLARVPQLFSLACRSGLGNRGSYFCGNPQAVRNPGFHGTHRLLSSFLLQGWACLQHPCRGHRCPWETQCICQVEAPSIWLERWAPIPTPNLLAPKGRGRAQLVEELGDLSVLSYLLGLLCLPRVPGKKKNLLWQLPIQASDLSRC